MPDRCKEALDGKVVSGLADAPLPHTGTIIALSDDPS